MNANDMGTMSGMAPVAGSPTAAVPGGSRGVPCPLSMPCGACAAMGACGVTALAPTAVAASPVRPVANGAQAMRVQTLRSVARAPEPPPPRA
ncbi:MAG: hypothetical protein ACYCVE_07915 [Gemmatimonadaceae bacterium]